MCHTVKPQINICKKKVSITHWLIDRIRVSTYKNKGIANGRLPFRDIIMSPSFTWEAIPLTYNSKLRALALQKNRILKNKHVFFKTLFQAIAYNSICRTWHSVKCRKLRIHKRWLSDANFINLVQSTLEVTCFSQVSTYFILQNT